MGKKPIEFQVLSVTIINNPFPCTQQRARSKEHPVNKMQYLTKSRCSRLGRKGENFIGQYGSDKNLFANEIPVET